MNNHDLLVQRFLDNELSPEERTAFLQAVDADAALRRHWLNLEMIAAEAAQLPKIVPSMLPSPPTMMMATYQMESSSVNDSSWAHIM
ncbi:MAG: hypothetical protein HP492_11500 [Nitrospira sp.]|nr:hypothetical protein [Nitrospira sp.]